MDADANMPAPLSGGQKQRVCLARAVANKPPMLLLDEATSALDPETEMHVVQTFEMLCQKYNMLIVSVTHRPNTARNAHKIVVLNEGVVEQFGTYSDLAKEEGRLFKTLLEASTKGAED